MEIFEIMGQRFGMNLSLDMLGNADIIYMVQ